MITKQISFLQVSVPLAPFPASEAVAHTDRSRSVLFSKNDVVSLVMATYTAHGRRFLSFEYVRKLAVAFNLPTIKLNNEINSISLISFTNSF